MKRSSKLLWWFLVALPIGVCGVVLLRGEIERHKVLLERYNRSGCLYHLELVRSAISNHVARCGIYPKTLHDLYPAYVEGPHRLKCPSDRSPRLYDTDYSSYLYSPPTNAIATNGVLVQERRGIHRVFGDLKPSYGILYTDGRIEMKDYEPDK